VGEEPRSTCESCGQEDDHPKHQVLLPGYVAHYHFDCPSEWHDLVVNPVPHEDEAARARQREVADTLRRTIELARSGVHGDELRQRIVRGDL
jgi:hypothetical protein